MTPRRMYLRAQRTAAVLDDPGLVSAFKAKQLEEPGTPLASNFPSLTKLNAAGYFALEDLDGADDTELRREAGLTPFEAQAVLAALGVS